MARKTSKRLLGKMPGLARIRPMTLTGKRALQLLLAVVLVVVGFVVIVSVPWKQIVREVQKPGSDEVLVRLTSADAAKRQAGLRLLGAAAVRRDPRITEAVTRIALEETDPALQAAAIGYLSRASGYSDGPAAPRQGLPQETIDAITEMLSEPPDPKLIPAVVEFVGNNAYWHPRRDEVIAHLIGLLARTQDRALREKVLYALQKFARDRGLPEDAYGTLLEVYTDRRRVATHEVRSVSEIFRRAAYRQVLPQAVVQAIGAALRSHPDQRVRYNAIYTFGGQGRQGDGIPAALVEATKAADPMIRDKARTQIMLIEKSRGEYLGKLMGTARDPNQPGRARSRALINAMRDYHKTDLFRDTALSLLADKDPVVRAAAVRTLPYVRQHPDYADDDKALLAQRDRAAQDPAAEVQIAAMHILWGFGLSRDELLMRFTQVLEGDDPMVITATLDFLRTTPLEDQRIERLIERHTHAVDAEVRRSAERTLAKYRERPPSLWQRFIVSAKDVKHHGLRLYWLLAGIGVLVAAAFAIYYMLRIIVYINERRLRALTAGGVMLVWIAMTYGMVYSFIVGAFAFGHNFLVSIPQQLLIDLVMGGSLLVYAGLGWAMHYLIRR
ncbi:MAG: hypothetical protein ACE5LB_11210 [Acidiferrobacterales bacterium]